MKKLKMTRGVTLTFEEGCNRYLENCRQRAFSVIQLFLSFKDYVVLIFN